MPVSFTCPHCGMETHVDDQYLGRSGPCAGCGITVAIPAYRDYNESSKSKWKSILSGGGIILGILILSAITMTIVAWVSLPAIQSAKSSVQTSRCSTNLKQIHAAMEAYHDKNGHYPPAYTTDESGKPLHSWRVLLLPYLNSEAQSIHRMLNLDEPWDSPMNARAIAQTPSVYLCAADPDNGLGTTSYMVINGRGFLFDGTKKSTRAELQKGDKPSHTIMIAEVASSGINWAEPIDVNIDKLAQGINTGSAGTLSSGHDGNGIHVVMADGTVRFLPDYTSPEDIEDMSTLDGGEIVELPK